MNYLQLAQRLRRRCRVSGNGPTAVTDQNEEYSRLLDWVNEAWMDIQLKRSNWWWMRASMSFPTVQAQAIYTLANIGVSDLGNWLPKTFRQYNTAAGLGSEIQISDMSYDSWRDTYYISGTRVGYSAPAQFAVTPQLGIALGPVPIAGYTITGDYFRVPSELVQDTDEPGLPEQFHMAIVYRAMMYYGASEAAPERYDEGEKEFKRMMERISLNQQDDVVAGPALA